MPKPKVQTGNGAGGIGLILWLTACTLPLVARAAEPKDDPGPLTPATLQFDFAQRLYEKKFYRTAVSQYEKFLQQHLPDEREAEATYRLADCHYRLGQPAKAIPHYDHVQRAFRKSKWGGRSLFRLGECRLRVKDAAGAAAVLTEYLKLGPPKELITPARFFLGLAREELKQYDEAHSHLHAAANDRDKANEYRPRALLHLADVCIRLARWPEAQQVLLDAVASYPKFRPADVFLRLGMVYQKQGDETGAVAAFGQVPRQSPLRAAAVDAMARSLFQLRDYPGALQACSELRRLTRDRTLLDRSYFLAGVSHFRQRHYAEAARAFHYLTEQPKVGAYTEEALLRECWSYYHLGRKQQAALRKAAHVFITRFPQAPKRFEVHFLLGDAFFWGKAFSEALEQFRRVPPTNAYAREAVHRIALCLHQMGQLDQAARAYQSFAETFAQDERAPDALRRAAAIWEYRQQYDQAVALYRKFLDRQPPTGAEYADGLYRLATCYRLLGQYESMEKTLLEYLKRADAKDRLEAEFFLGEHYRRLGDQAGDHAAQARQADEPAAAQGHRTQSASYYQHAALHYRRAADKKSKRLARTWQAMARGYHAKGVVHRTSVDQLQFDLDTRRQKGEPIPPELPRDLQAQRQAEAAAFRNAADAYFQIITSRPQPPADEETHIWTGQFYRQHGRPRRARIVYEQLVSTHPETKWFDYALYELAMAAADLQPPDWNLCLKGIDRLLGHYAKQLQADPQAETRLLVPATLGKARALAALKKLDQARPLFDQVLEKVRRGSTIYRQAIVALAEVEFQRRNYSRAQVLYLEIGMTYRDPELSPPALYWAGRCALELSEQADGEEEKQRHRRAAVATWRELVDRFPQTRSTQDARRDAARAEIQL